MYYADLSPVKVLGGFLYKEYAVGWLAHGKEYPTGVVLPEKMDVLFNLCARPVLKTRGFNVCGFCPHTIEPVRIERAGKTNFVGSGVIRVRGKWRSVYVAPDMIYHYVAVHNYLPPAEFLEALG